jgi:N-methylhydantoinase A
LDPRDFSLVPFGGGGGLQAADLAEILGIRRIVVPVAPGVTSGLGCLCVDIVHNASEALITAISQVDVAAVNDVLLRLSEQMVRRLTEDGVATRDQLLEFSADVRYLGQVRGLTIPLAASTVGPKFADEISDAFFREYERQFHSYSTDIPIELAALRVQGSRPVKPPRIPFKASAGLTTGSTCEVVTRSGPVTASIVHRAALTPGTSLAGPLVVTQNDSTTWVPPGWVVDVNPIGNLIMAMEGLKQ